MMFSKIMTKTATFAAAAMVGVAALANGANTAVAQEAEAEAIAQDVVEKAPVILIVDQARLLATSEAGQSVSEQMQVLQDTVNKELETVVARLVKEGEELQGKQETMEEAAYIEAAQRIALQQQNVPVLREIRVRELSMSEQRAYAEISEKMRPILEEIVNARGATVLLDRSAIMYGAAEADITQEVLERLNEEIKTVRVERVNLAQEQQQRQQRAQ